ncbi:Zn(II)2Cys6 transcription factor [Aspergillus foveolatus]|uniref:Zn(II)2Cys6 transcription factor n=1 Tax=Aspergillus foveolatus TaxID=210207 RepID=UPI003CCDD5B8
MAENRPLPRNRVKTRTGCLRCKQRRIKCDETHPHCNQCKRRAYDCPGYQRPLEWSSKYEVAANNDAAARKDARSKPTINAGTPDLTVNTISPILSPSASVPGSTPQHLPMTTGLAEQDASHYTASPDASFPEFEFNNISPPQYEQISSSFLGSVQLPDVFNTNLGEWADLTVSLPLPLEDQDTRISRYYFFKVCRINSCFDSGTNPMRVQIHDQMAFSGLIYHCVLSMSAAHEGSIGSTALTYRSKAVTCLKSELTRLKEETDSEKPLGSTDLSSALLGCILLGMTDAWHRPSNLGITHLHGARCLFKRWISTTGTNDGAVTASPRDFLIGIMVYWESLASFFTDQSLDAIAYLYAFCEEGISIGTRIHPNPWAGICTPLFVYLAKAGTLARQRSLAKNLSNLTAGPSATSIQTQLIAELTGHARQTETALLQYEIPAEDRIRETADHLTPISHLQKMAQIYRLAALLEIYRNFPSLLRTESNTTPGSTTQSQELERPLENSSSKDKLLTLATAILTLIMGLPRTSGVNCVMTIPLIIAGSTLQPVTPTFVGARKAEKESGRKDSYQLETETATAWNTLASEILSISAQEETRLYWRDLVRERLRAVHSYVGLASVLRALDILENVWARSDFQAIATDGEAVLEFVQWTEVMVGEKLETVLG